MSFNSKFWVEVEQIFLSESADVTKIYPISYCLLCFEIFAHNPVASFSFVALASLFFLQHQTNPLFYLLLVV